MLFLCAFGMTLVYVFMPIFAPNQVLYIVLVLAFNLFGLPLGNNTLIQDYVEKETIGRAVSLASLTGTLGLVVGLMVLY